MTTTPITPGSIVVAVDGSKHALRAVNWAAEQAHLEKRTLTIVHAAGEGDVRSVATAYNAGTRPYDLPDLLHQSRAIIDDAVELARGMRPDLTLETHSAVGHPRQVLVDISVRAHLIVMGSRGRGAVHSKLMGSVSAHVAKAVRCPLIVLRPDAPGILKDGVVVAADATAESLPVVEFAFAQAAIHGAPLTILHCVSDRAETPIEHARFLAESVAGLSEKYPDVHVTREMRNGRVEECLAAHPRPWNLVVVGRHPIHGLGWLTSSTAVDVMERSTSPIAVVPEAEAVG